MEAKEKLEKLEEMFELDEGTLSEDTLLDDIEEWDSMSKLSLIVLLDDDFGKKVTGEQINGLVKIKDILKLME
ncbi:MAG: hypothetical protein JW866_10195 [Ignavibacteriales bacterium]|nr:hypothetical protein [Ignavibacteriales bacterium]